MRKIIVLSFLTIDGVMQAPGGPGEDTSGDFKYGGWLAPYSNEEAGKIIAEHMAPADLLLGRKTFEIFESYWPSHADFWPGINEVTKYVFSTTRQQSSWQNTVFLSSVSEIAHLKNTAGSNLKVWGSSKLAQLLLKHNLVDELWLKIYPITLGNGKKLFANEAVPATFTLVESTVTSNGIVILNYRRSGEVKTGIIEPE